MRDKARLELTESEIEELQHIIHENSGCIKLCRKCNILLELTRKSRKTLRDIAKDNNVCVGTVINIRDTYKDGGIQAVKVLRANKNGKQHYKINDDISEKIIKLANSPVPDGYKRWTLRLIAEELKEETGLDISHESIRKVLTDRKIGLGSRCEFKLTEGQIKELEDLMNKQKKYNRIYERCKILIELCSGDKKTMHEVAKNNNVVDTTIMKLRNMYIENGIEAMEVYNLNRYADSIEDKLIEITNSPVPVGHNRWTINLLTDRLNEELGTRVSFEYVRKKLIDNKIDLKSTAV